MASELLVVGCASSFSWRVSPRHFVQLVTLKVAVGDAEAVVTAEFEQTLPVLIHPADAKMAEAGRPCLPVGPNTSVEIA